ncbi:DUF1972 domain-containing protein [Vibrio breoganii]
MKNIAIVGTVGLPACYGGFESLVENLVRYRSNDIKYRVFCSKNSYVEHPEEIDGAKLTYIPLNANGIFSVLYDVVSLVYCTRYKPDTILILGVSGCLFLPIFKCFSSARIVTNIDGLEWKRNKWGRFARKFLKWSESAAVKYSDIIVSDNQGIGDYVSEEYGLFSEIIAYGGDQALRDIQVEKCHKYALGLCRIEPENNVEMILSAFSKLPMNIKFVGNWNNSDYGLNLKSKYEKHENIELLDPVYDLDILFRLRVNADLYIHGHSAGGTNPSLVEMMHFGVPIYAFDCKFNRYSTEEKAIFFEDDKDLLEKITTTCTIQNKAVGASMKEIAQRLYRWQVIVESYEKIYQTSK